MNVEDYKGLSGEEKVNKVIGWLDSSRSIKQIHNLIKMMCSSREESVQTYQSAVEKFFSRSGGL